MASGVETRRVVLVAVGVAGIVATAVTAWAVANSPILVERSGDVVWRSLFVAVYVPVGEYTWWRRPESRLGPIVAGIGFLYGVTSMNASGDALVYTLGMGVGRGPSVRPGSLSVSWAAAWRGCRHRALRSSGAQCAVR